MIAFAITFMMTGLNFGTGVASAHSSADDETGKHITTSTTTLLARIKADVFDLPEDLFVVRVAEAVPEAAFMFGNSRETTEGRYRREDTMHSISQQLSGHFSSEAERAWLGVMCLYWAYRGTHRDYEHFVAGQTSNTQMLRETFNEMHAYVRQLLTSDEAIRMALWTILCNDLGKTAHYEALYESIRGPHEPSQLDHDQLLGYLLEHQPSAFASYSTFSAQQRSAIASGFTSGCDIAHFAHLEMPASVLQNLRYLSKRSREMYVLHTIFDVAGAKAHVGGPGSLTMDEQTWHIYADVREALRHLDAPETTGAALFSHYANLRSRRIKLDHSQEEAPVLQVLAAMGRLSVASDGDVLRHAWGQLSGAERAVLARELTIYRHDQSAIEPIQISYGPTFIHNGIALFTADQVSVANKTAGLTFGLRLLARVFESARHMLERGALSGHLPSSRTIHVDARSIAGQIFRTPDEMLDSHLVFTPTDLGAIADSYIRNVLSPFRGVIFDCDGVLIDSETLKFEAWQKALLTYGVSLNPDHYKAWVGFDNQYILSQVREEVGGNVFVPDSVIGQKEKIFERLQNRTKKPIEANLLFLRRLAAARTVLHFKLGLASSSSRRQIEHTLKSLGIADLFDAIISGQDDLTHIKEQLRNKPSPYIYQKAAKALGVDDPQTILVFEDSSAGVKAAHGAGMVTCAIPNAWTESQDFEVASSVKNSLFGDDVMPILQTISECAARKIAGRSCP